MSIPLNEFSQILGVPKPIGKVTGRLKYKFLINFEENMKEILSGIIRIRTWDSKQIKNHKFMNLIQLYQFFVEKI